MRWRRGRLRGVVLDVYVGEFERLAAGDAVA